MPVWKASREGIRGEERGKGKRRRTCEAWVKGGVLRGMRQKRIWCVVEASCITSSAFLWVWSQQHILFCHYLSAPAIHLPNVANWLLKGVTYSRLVFGKRIHGGLCKQAILKCKWSCLREATHSGFFFFGLCGALSWLYNVGMSAHYHWSARIKRNLIAQNQFFWLTRKGRLTEMKQCGVYQKPQTQISSLHLIFYILSDCRLKVYIHPALQNYSYLLNFRLKPQNSKNFMWQTDTNKFISVKWN